MGGDAAADRAALDAHYEDLGGTLGDALLAIHPSYHDALAPVLRRAHGIAHITGGGIVDNVPRILPDGLAARFERGSWDVLPIFELIQDRGDISDHDMYHTFNMGIGIVIAVAAGNADGVMRDVPALRRVGAVTRQADERRVVIE